MHPTGHSTEQSRITDTEANDISINARCVKLVLKKRIEFRK